jgi:hypothetical protein
MSIRSIVQAFVIFAVIGSTAVLAEAGQVCTTSIQQTGQECDPVVECDEYGCYTYSQQCTPVYGPVTNCVNTPDPTPGPTVEDRTGRGHF